MELLGAFGLKAVGALTLLWALLLLMWRWDDALLRGTAAKLDEEMKAGRPSAATVDAAVEALLSATLGPRLSLGRKAWAVLRTTLVSTFAMLLIYFMAIDEHVPALFGSLEAVKRLSLQFVLSGLATVYGSLWVADAVAGMLIPRLSRAGATATSLFIAFDLAVKLAALHLVTAATYVAAASLFGSFGGEPRLALGAVRESVALALRMENLTAVYVYAVLISGFPLFLTLMLRLCQIGDALPFLWRRLRPIFGVDKAPVRALAAVLAVFMAGCGLVAASMLSGAAGAAAAALAR